MNDVEIDNILQCAEKYKNMCVNIDIFVDFLRSPVLHNNFIRMDNINQLKNGHYGNLLNCQVWVKKIESKYIQISNENDLQKYENGNWSPSVPIKYANQIEKMLELKSFW